MEQFIADLDMYTVAFLVIAGFIACFIDSTVGGGGLISTPALLALGMPVPLALGTNKLAASTGAFTSVLSFWRAGKINKKVALCFMPLSFIGSAVGADEVQIWTDIDGVHNNDPRIVENTSPVRNLHFEESAELAYFGAKILHPTCILPAKLTGTPVRLLNTMDPTAEGTRIDNNLTSPGEIKAIAAKDNITAIKIKSGRMLLAYGFLRKVFEIFETHKTSIDMISTSEVGVSVSIDDDKRLDDIVAELQKIGTITVDRNMCIICVVGDLNWENVGFEARAMEAMKDIPVRMVSYGGSNYNISFLVREEDKVRALRSLSATIFDAKK